MSSPFSPLAPMPQQPAYMLTDTITIHLRSTSTYGQLLKQYDGALLGTINQINSSILTNVIYLCVVDMQPENIQWKLWKSQKEIRKFLANVQDQIKEMLVNQHRAQGNSADIDRMHKELKNMSTMNNQSAKQFFDFLNMIASNPYLRKTQQFLLFIDHCIPVDKWDMKIYKQITIYKSPSMFANFFNSKDSQKPRDFFITITSDGILKSDNHLQESRIRMMIPFTNQLTIQCKKSPEKFISFIIQSCQHEQLAINFYEPDQAINFAVALQMALEESSYCESHRFKSYAPVREGCASKLYCDGAEYYQDLYENLMAAKWQVCITGWMITPYFLLKRPNSIENKECRLDGVLEILAKRGVKIYIIVFMEPSMFVNNDSEHVQIYLESLHDNIKVYRHPNDKVPILWSHHEKMVIIDQEIGFMGGLDICYGRWDFSQHPLTDPPGQLLWDGADYNNYRTKDVSQPRKYKQSNLNRNFQPRMPWHDIALQFRGDVVLDLLRHFVQYWYYVKSELLTDPAKTLNFLKRRYEQAFYDIKTNKQEVKYYLTEIKKRQEVASFAQKMKYMFNGRAERYPELLIQNMPGKRVGNETLQMCRSASDWSIGIRLDQIQSSIHQAYQTLITESKNFIYIENQFFMGLENKVVECIAKRLEKAIRNNQPFKLIVVMPLLPGFQGDIGNPASTVLRIQVHYQYQAILRSEASLYKRLFKVIDQVQKTHGVKLNIQDYIYFFGLRQSQYVNDTPTTQIIYVHSKLMIVDDQRCIIGSANINDRSLLGNRDSQLACVIEESKGSIRDLRARIFAEHFGLTRRESDNFMAKQVWDSILANSKMATEFYRQVFGCIPDDNVTTSLDIQKLENKRSFNNQLFDQGRGKLKGHAVDFPLKFMESEDLTIKFGKMEYFAPDISFT